MKNALMHMDDIIKVPKMCNVLMCLIPGKYICHEEKNEQFLKAKTLPFEDTILYYYSEYEIQLKEVNE